jgi:gamma-glutamylcyclotransferase (GGCT)/AIG2-like uncharacterized protein YtfP
MPAVNVFTYGSLMFAPVWDKVCEGRYATQKLTLQNFQRYCVVGESYPAIVSELGAVVEGLVYISVSQADQLRLNQFEGDEYVLRNATINSIDVSFYEFVALDRLEKRPWSPSEFERKGLPAFLTSQVGGFLANGIRGTKGTKGTNGTNGTNGVSATNGSDDG